MDRRCQIIQSKPYGLKGTFLLPAKQNPLLNFSVPSLMDSYTWTSGPTWFIKTWASWCCELPHTATMCKRFRSDFFRVGLPRSRFIHTFCCWVPTGRSCKPWSEPGARPHSSPKYGGPRDGTTTGGWDLFAAAPNFDAGTMEHVMQKMFHLHSLPQDTWCFLGKGWYRSSVDVCLLVRSSAERRWGSLQCHATTS